MIPITPQSIRFYSKLGQRGALFGSAIFPLAESHPEVVVMTADLGYLSGLDRFKSIHPSRFVNVGIAEQTLVGMGAGLAFEGRIPILTTYATFLTMRACEQVRHFLGYMQANVKMVGSGAGLVMGFSGNTHYTFEDLAITRAIPNLVVLSPADATEAVKALEAAIKIPGPVYIRLTGGLNNPIVYHEDYEFTIGKAVSLRDDGIIALIATGSMVHHAIQAADILQKHDISAKVLNIHSIKPLDRASIAAIAERVKLLVTIEEHSTINGLGAAVAEEICCCSTHPPLLRLGIRDEYKHAGDYSDLLQRNGLSPSQIADSVLRRLDSDHVHI